MPITWKSPKRFKPAPVLKQISSVRTVSDAGEVSYSGLEFEECLPTLQSMLHFPPAASEVDTQTLVWQALSRAGTDLKPETFLAALNSVLAERLAVRENDYYILTSVSLDLVGLPRTYTVLDSRVEFWPNDYPRKFNSRHTVVNSHRISLPETPVTYVKAVVKVRAKSDRSAFLKAMRAIDLQRAILCMMANPTMQYSLGGSLSQEPINAIRLGSRHTVHLESGESARDGLWYEPSFVPVKPHRFKKPAVVLKNLRSALRRVAASQFKSDLTSALLRFVRALDQSDPNTAFLRLWSALEALTTPRVAEYDKLIRRVTFLFREQDYHRQVLEHLREYRNANVHAGEESDNAKIHCFQLQMYFISVAWFFIQNALRFSSIDDAGEFLDLPHDQSELKRRLALIKRAIKFTAPSNG